jgi:diguanylate cyclase (GGDEF)-like protein
VKSEPSPNPPPHPRAEDGPKAPNGELLYTPVEERFERLTRLGRRALNVPVAAVMLVDDGKQWFKSIAGWDVAELSEEQALCSWAIDTPGVTIIEDMLKDARTAQHPFVKGKPKFRFFAGYPLLAPDGWPIGGFFVLDLKPRRFSFRKQQSLCDLAELAQHEIASSPTVSLESSLTANLSIARREALIDPLTRLWNRRGVDELLADALERADTRSQSLAVAVIDIEGFREINARHGRQGGDVVLCKVASRLLTAVRGNDAVFRVGDDKFLLLMTNLAATVAQRVLERVCWTLCESRIATDGGDVRVSVTTGLVCRPPGEKVTVAELLARANDACAGAKTHQSAAKA